jgi:enoyl-CoA hydratase/carnithine racemase
VPYETIILRREAGVGYIILNRPETFNSLNDRMMIEFVQVVDEVASDPEVKVVVITGKGRGFCSGADMGHSLFTSTAAEIEQIINSWHQVPTKLRGMPKPVIASVNGAAVGGGAGLALACDIIIASEQARFGQVFANLGIHADSGATYTLPRLVGVARAMELFLTGRIVDAREAEAMGMVNKVVPAESLESTTKELAESLAAGSALALGMVKHSVYQALQTDLATALRREASCLAITAASEDCKEGTRAFLEKRKPEFKSR